jgi:molybdate transport system permease protein
MAEHAAMPGTALSAPSPSGTMATHGRGRPAKAPTSDAGSGRRAERDPETVPPGVGAPTVIFAVPAAVLVGFIILPIIALVWRGVTTPEFWSSIRSPLVLEALRLTLVTTMGTLSIVVITGTPLAYLLARGRFPGRAVLQTVTDLPLVLPPMVAGVALLMAFGRQGLLGEQLAFLGLDLPFTTAAVVLAQVFVAGPFYIRGATLGFSGVARDVEEAAAIDGATFWQGFRHVTLPLARPGLTGGAVLCLGRALSEFGATLLFAGNFEGRTQTMSLAILQAMQSDLPAALVLAVLLVAVATTVLVLSQALGARLDER